MHGPPLPTPPHPRKSLEQCHGWYKYSRLFLVFLGVTIMSREGKLWNKMTCVTAYTDFSRMRRKHKSEGPKDTLEIASAQVNLFIYSQNFALLGIISRVRQLSPPSPFLLNSRSITYFIWTCFFIITIKIP